MGFWDSLTGKSASDAANAAAADTYAKQQAATKSLTAYGDTLPGQYNQISQAYSPYVNAGSGALSQLLNGLGLNGAQGSANFAQGYQNLPGYQEGLNTGTTAAQRALNAGNAGQSGGALKALYRFGSDYENQRSGDYLTRLMGLQGQGLQATGAQVGTQAQGIGANTGIRQSAYGGDMNSAGTIGQGMVAGAQAEQQGATNLARLGLSAAGMAAGGLRGGLGGGVSSYLGGLMSPSGTNPFNPNGTRNTWAYGS